MRTFELFFLAIALLLAGPVSAQEISYKFRGIALGDSPLKVQKSLSEQFPHVGEMEKIMGGGFWVIAGDREGMTRKRCPIAAEAALRIDCLNTMVVLRLVNDRIQVLQITANQSFGKPVALSSFMERVDATYGKPSAVYLTGQDSHRSGFIERTYAWGGKTLPAKDFKMSSIPYEDSELIGGQFILMRLVLNGEAVVGYELRISDADKSIQLAQKWRAEQKAKSSTSGGTAPNNLKF